LVEYDGTRYYGWQRQPNQTTIQGKLESVLSLMCGRETEVIGAGRTDGGVHAKGMTANVFLETTLSAEEIRDYLNRYLPDDIAVLEVREASLRFHARYNATGKTYLYTCFDGDVKPVFDRKYYTRLEEKHDVERMRQAADILMGEHDFRNFCVNPRMKKSTVRIVNRIDIEREGGYIRFTFHGTGFLQNMVRIMVGTLLEVGTGRMSAEQVRAVLENPERQKAGPTAPAQGLCLMEVDYD
jgi:tRNA pseudouridine38-40 synthase